LIGIRTVLTVLATLPTRAPVSRRAAGWLTTFAPVGGLLLGLLTGLVVFALRLWAQLPSGQAQPLLPAATGLTILALLTSARHLAGLAVVTDALAAGRAGPLWPGRTAPATALPTPALPAGGLPAGSGGARPAHPTGARTAGGSPVASPRPTGPVGETPGGTVAGGEAHPGASRQPALVSARAAPGPAGTAAVVFIPLIQLFALSTAILAHRGTVTIIVACLASRLSVTLACTRRHPTTTEPLGPPTAAAESGAEPPVRRVVFAAVGPARAGLAAALALVLAATAGRFDYDGGGTDRAIRAVIALLVATTLGLVLRRVLTRRFAGLTEPVLGALIELTATLAILTMALTVPHSLRS